MSQLKAPSYTRVSPTRTLQSKIFNRKVKALQRSRIDPSACHLHRICAEQLLDRRSFIKRETPVVLEVGAHGGWYFKAMLKAQNFGGLKQYIQTDISEDRLNQNYEEIKDLIPPGVEFVQICCDEEDENPFGLPDRSVDMICSNLSMHWCNDLEGTMGSFRRTLKRDGFVLMTMFGGNTLYELRSCLSMAQTDTLGGVAPHVSPMVDGAGISTLLLQSGFNLPSIDLDRHVLMYESPFHVMEHISAMGESACHLIKKPLSRDVLAGSAALYDHLYKKNHLIPATFEIFYAIGWSPHPSQASPLERGSATVPLSSISTSEHKDLRKALDQYAENPTDPALQSNAEELWRKLRDDTVATAQKRGIDTRGLDSGSTTTNSPEQLAAKKPAPPFQ